MSKIQTFLDKILASKYGKDVRQSIHDAIKEIDNEAKAFVTKVMDILEKGSLVGAQGTQGPQGEKGEKGDTGLQGAIGATGATGPQGEAGKDGAQGAQGEKGEKGDTGPQGEKGDKGDTGASGATGAQGAQGIQGEKGDTGEKGDKGDPGESGVTTPLNGFFTLSVDADGNLWAYSAEGGTTPDFEYDNETGDLYILQEVS